MNLLMLEKSTYLFLILYDQSDLQSTSFMSYVFDELLSVSVNLRVLLKILMIMVS